MKLYGRAILLVLLVAALAWSFWASAGWLQLCAGLALFLFGMQCLEEGLRQLAGSKLEQLLGRSTATPGKAMLFGIGGTMLLQSSTLVSLLTIAFISTGLIQLAGGIAILFGANLGATSGIWLLAMAGQNLSLSPLALPLLVLGVLAGFNGAKSKAAGRIVLGIAFIFLGIDQIKEGFASFGGELDMGAYQVEGLSGQLLFSAIGLVGTVVLQSSHATLMLTLAALAGGQLELGQSLAIAIGSNVGSSVSTAVVGSLGGNRSGQRLALAHVLFNVVTALLAFVLLAPFTGLVLWLAGLAGFGDNSLIQLALFHSLFNAFGVLLFWPWQGRLAQLLVRWLPESVEPQVLITELATPGPQEPPLTRARYLSEQALDSVDAAASAVMQELRHLGRLSLEVICHALYLPVAQLAQARVDEALLRAAPDARALDAEALYQRHIKGVYGDLLSFMGRLELPLDEAHRQFWLAAQLAALQLVDAVKDAKHLQKNLGQQLRQPPSTVRGAYVELRGHLLALLHDLHELARTELSDEAWSARLHLLDDEAAEFDRTYRERLFAMVRQGQLDGLQTSSLMNDLGYVGRIFQSLRNVLLLAEEQGPLYGLRQVAMENTPLIVVE
ncbi:sodium:phosphate symporter [Pseudomonas alcaligenes]|uniref:Sodium:phosphate symporter n=1 Tax=Aquipseudomonas alcaligenes TaxID=43263 RepID=A0ABR7S4X9_AQUAC|nr:Na/Pi symporter [Pseudomonas alcaligenes]MBC9252635.1 sodium:phosphate symporter [Pseudomonas alcaligenes]